MHGPRFSAAAWARLSPEERAAHTTGNCNACALLHAADPALRQVGLLEAMPARKRPAAGETSGAEKSVNEGAYRAHALLCVCSVLCVRSVHFLSLEIL